MLVHPVGLDHLRLRIRNCSSVRKSPSNPSTFGPFVFGYPDKSWWCNDRRYAAVVQSLKITISRGSSMVRPFLSARNFFAIS